MAMYSLLFWQKQFLWNGIIENKIENYFEKNLWWWIEDLTKNKV